MGCTASKATTEKETAAAPPQPCETTPSPCPVSAIVAESAEVTPSTLAGEGAEQPTLVEPAADDTTAAATVDVVQPHEVVASTTSRHNDKNNAGHHHKKQRGEGSAKRRGRQLHRKTKTPNTTQPDTVVIPNTTGAAAEGYENQENSSVVSPKRIDNKLLPVFTPPPSKEISPPSVDEASAVAVVCSTILHNSPMKNAPSPTHGGPMTTMKSSLKIKAKPPTTAPLPTTMVAPSPSAIVVVQQPQRKRVAFAAPAAAMEKKSTAQKKAMMSQRAYKNNNNVGRKQKTNNNKSGVAPPGGSNIDSEMFQQMTAAFERLLTHADHLQMALNTR